ncbi:energy transducer TonB [Carboxylicivirga taeanensis]|uniref:energy transducer TonB n=1 Tax=Carboxylicivirga taeanensis TaxID=1416875 RepID=UPI003F6E0E96
MSKQKKHIKLNDADAFRRYMDSEMQPEEAHRFERHLLNDSFESEAMEGLSSIGTNAAFQDLASVKTKIGKQQAPSRLRIFSYVAASVAVVIGIISMLMLTQAPQLPAVSDNMAAKKQQEQPQTKSALQPNNRKQLAPEPTSSTTNKTTTTAKQSSKPDETKATRQAAGKQITAPIKAYTDFELATTEQINIEAPQQASQPSRLEEEVMTVDYGTLEGVSLQATSTSNADKQLDLERRLMEDKHKPLSPLSETSKQRYWTTAASSSIGQDPNNPQGDSSKTNQLISHAFLPQETEFQYKDTFHSTPTKEEFALSEVVTISSSDESLQLIEQTNRAVPEGGMEKYIAEIEQQLRYPANGSGKSERIVALVTISHKGHIKHIEIKRSPGEAYSIEAVRAIRNGAQWQPATDKGFPVEDTIKLKLQFHPK